MLTDPTLDIRDMSSSDTDLSEIGRHIFVMMMTYGDLQKLMHPVQQETRVKLYKHVYLIRPTYLIFQTLLKYKL